VHWTAIRDRIFDRVDAVSESGRAYREKSENVTLFTEPSRFVGDRTLRIGSGPTITADRFVLAAGSFLYLGYHAVDAEYKRRGALPALLPAFTGVAGSSVVRLVGGGHRLF